MLSKYFKNLIRSNKEFILKEAVEVKGLMHLLMKERNTGEKWSEEEKTELKSHLKIISRAVPLLVIFILPGGSLLLPFLADAIDRRSGQR